MRRGTFGTTVNAVAAKLIDAPLVGRLVRRNTVMISYVGRRSGKTFTTPVSYRRGGGEIVIRVMFPDGKNWWRNFLDGGGPIALQLNRSHRTGHAVAVRDERGRVTVTVKLDDQ
ncbi:hypothetical protein BN1232_01663 [Mycobacterium lentiflavum]|uniref:Deazaflavin-dependent nitroreductase family protein n=1 Tax=Mycobacterium lentiflavum TaxID=141349 RepID=A0A0E3WBS2_MYCLN|nr:nitroreductase/quinone reductase family protein [Mycobacterium lentiflavum]CQD09151.1 hypothetical protein BN1232_01663 [Mycobacterium lentiflavum]